ncbi:uncharacterized protein LOC110630216 isoform X2 [Manihot esculenta]|uniref:uncharacterized protein LOC110630216 isoform X2 n=1 Tax=Manihot esculenta TaxID=3983 RepID=UPI001CC6CC32|nr:uncharacterized protein LOC110630216 isoform X2 [Manihot esculenta]
MCDYSLFLFLFKSKLKLGLPFGFDFSVLFFCRCLLGLLLRLTFIACHSSFPVMKESFIFLISSFLLNRSTNSTLLWAGYVSILFLNPEITTAAFLASSGSSITNDSFQQVRVSWIHGLDLSMGF